MKLPRMKTFAALALAEETEVARRALYDLLPRFPPGEFTTGDPEVEDNLRGILCHVTACILSYSCWMRRVLGRLDPAVEKAEKASFRERIGSLTDAEGFTSAGEEASAHYYETMAAVSDEEMGREFVTNWGQTSSIDFMMEHALVHLLRHRRQLQILLGDRGRGVLAEPRSAAGG